MFLKKDESGTWNTSPAVPEEMLPNVNCHKFVLFALGKISFDELKSDPAEMKKSDPAFDVAYAGKALEISDAGFTAVPDATSLIALADRECGAGKTCVGQIKDSKTGEMAHSFIVEKDLDGKYMCQEKMGFKHYPFEVREIGSLLEFVNDKGEKSYQNQLWRFIPLDNGGA